jgi:hypothetical protein
MIERFDPRTTTIGATTIVRDQIMPEVNVGRTLSENQDAVVVVSVVVVLGSKLSIASSFSFCCWSLKFCARWNPNGMRRSTSCGSFVDESDNVDCGRSVGMRKITFPAPNGIFTSTYGRKNATTILCIFILAIEISWTVRGQFQTVLITTAAVCLVCILGYLVLRPTSSLWLGAGDSMRLMRRGAHHASVALLIIGVGCQALLAAAIAPRDVG